MTAKGKSPALDVTHRVIHDEQAEPKKMSSWCKLGEGWLKCNVDASFIKKTIQDRGVRFCDTIMGKLCAQLRG